MEWNEARALNRNLEESNRLLRRLVETGEERNKLAAAYMAYNADLMDEDELATIVRPHLPPRDGR